MRDFAVVGSGVGGSSIAALLSSQGYNVVLFEKEPYLGGCSSSFEHKGYTYNTGATTLAGYEEGYIVKEIFDAIGFTPELIKTDPSIVIYQNGKITPRYKDFEKFLQVLNENYPHPKNREFWELIYKLNKDFYTHSSYYYKNSNIFAKIKSLLSFVPLALKFQKYLRVSADSFVKDFLGSLSDEYMQFLQAQILIVAQAPMREINFLTAALSLAYTFNENHYVKGGFSKIFDGLTQGVQQINRKTEVLKVERGEGYFDIYTKHGVCRAQKVILNSTIYDSAMLFEETGIQKYYKKYEKLNNHQSSFMLYMTIKSKKKFHHHYQIITDEILKYTLSKAIFVSFSDVNDNEIAPKGHYSITASIHTDTRFWEDKKSYKAQKQELLGILQKRIIETLGIDEAEIVQSFGATPKSFKRYIKRSQLGGNAITMKNFLPILPGNDTPIAGLYNVGDSVYAAQGWPGVMLGVKNLKRIIDV